MNSTPKGNSGHIPQSQPPHSSLYTAVGVKTSQSASLMFPPNNGCPTQGTLLEPAAQSISETAVLNHTEHLLHKVTLARLRDIADAPNTQKQIHGGSQNRETKKHTSNETAEEISRKKY